MSGQDSIAVVTRFFAAFADEDRDNKVKACFAPDAQVWCSAGPPRWGAVASISDYLELADAFAAVVSGPLEGELGTVFADGEHVSVQMRTSVPLSNGRVYDNHYHFYFRVRDGVIVVMKEYYDTLHVEAVLEGTSMRSPTDPPAQPQARGTNLFDRAP